MDNGYAGCSIVLSCEGQFHGRTQVALVLTSVSKLQQCIVRPESGVRLSYRPPAPEAIMLVTLT